MILITDTDKTRRSTVAEMFYYMGIPSLAVAPEDVISTARDEYSALLFTSADLTPDAKGISAAVRTIGITTVALSDGDGEDFDLILPPGTCTAKIASAVSEHRKSRGLPPLGRYECMGIDASADLGAPTYLGRTLPLTRTEAMILRYLIRSYPKPAPVDEILKLAFRGSRTPEPASVRTHISIMNKKLRDILGRSLTEPSGKGGYLLSGLKIPETV